jgi:hypothetical protein
MKKLILTSALFFAFAFSYANDNEKKLETSSTEPKRIEVDKRDVTILKVAQPVIMPECYQLSCGVFCYEHAIETEPGCDIECVFEMLEIFECS